jgi:hypothetical protein
MEIHEPFNPLHKKNLGISVAEALLAKKVESLPPKKQFEGAGIYAIYYVGNFPAYKAITKLNSGRNFKCPIYVGKAVPEGARKGGFGLDTPAGNVLFKRLCEHAKSIQQTKNLSLSDFFCRYLTVDDIWIPLGESLLVEMFSPLWNKAVDGFGNHDPGSGRYNQQLSPWDALHPGRSWTVKLKPGKSGEEVAESVTKYLISHKK